MDDINRPDNQIGKTITIDIAGATDRTTETIKITVEGIEDRAVDPRKYPSTACSKAIVVKRKRCPDDQIGKTIAIDIAGATDRTAKKVPRRIAVEGIEDRAVDPRKDSSEAYVRDAYLVDISRPDNQIGKTITIDIAGATDGTAERIYIGVEGIEDRAVDPREDSSTA